MLACRLIHKPGLSNTMQDTVNLQKGFVPGYLCIRNLLGTEKMLVN